MQIKYGQIDRVNFDLSMGLTLSTLTMLKFINAFTFISFESEFVQNPKNILFSKCLIKLGQTTK